MTDFQITEGKIWHCGEMTRRLREEHRRAVLSLGLDTHRGLRGKFQESAFCRAWLIDGTLAALGGVSGMKVSATGFLWIALSELAARYPVALIREARRQLAEIMMVKRELVTTILPNDPAAQRLAIFLGFHVSDDGNGAPAWTRSDRARLARFISVDEKCKVPFGGSHVIVMGYHAMEMM